MKKEIQIPRSRDRPRLPLFENCNQRFPPLAKRVAPVSLNQKFDTTKCLRNQLRMVGIFTLCWCNWGSLTSASSPLTKIVVRTKKKMTSSHSNRFYKKTISSHCLDLRKATVCFLHCGHFEPKDFSIK